MTTHLPRLINHIGLTVTDLDRAIAWYREVFGFEVIHGPAESVADGSYYGRLSVDIFGAEFKKLRFVHMDTGNGIGLEIFEFIEPRSEQRPNTFEYWKGGFFHICVTDPHVEALAQKIERHGGKRRSELWEVYEGSGYYAIYCEDPFGNSIEIFSHNYELVHSNR